MVASSTLRMLRLLSAVNVVLAVAVIVVRAVEGTTLQAVAPQICFGLGFAAMFASSVLEMKKEGSGRLWMALGGLLLVAASVFHFLGK